MKLATVVPEPDTNAQTNGVLKNSESFGNIDKHHRHHGHMSKAEIKELLKKSERAVVECSVTTSDTFGHFRPREFKGVQLYKGIFGTFFNLCKIGQKCHL
jgi:hypothetical protein